MNGNNESDENKEKFLQTKLFEAISHPTRIKILKILNESELGFSELKRKLNISSSGNLTHHLNKLLNLIRNNHYGNYEITDIGKDALFIIDIAAQKDKNWIFNLYSVMSALIFYSIYISIAFILSSFPIFKFNALISIIIALIPSTIIFYSTNLIFKMKFRNTK